MEPIRPRPQNSAYARLFALVLLGTAGPAALADGDTAPQWHLDGASSVGYDSNPGNAESGSAVPATGFGSATLALSLSLRPSPRFAAVLRGSVAGEQYFNYVGLSNARAAGLLRLFYHPGDSFRAPTLSAWGEAAAWQFGSRQRSGAEYRAGLAASELLNTALRLRAGVYGIRRNAQSAVFDGEQGVAALDLDWFVTDTVTVYAGYEFRYGDFAESSAYDSGAAEYALAIAQDDTLMRNGAPQIAYRLVGHAEVSTLGLNIPLNSRISLDAQGREFHTRAADTGEHYNRWLAEISLLARF